jgi:hypothetical protein
MPPYQQRKRKSANQALMRNLDHAIVIRAPGGNPYMPQKVMVECGPWRADSLSHLYSTPGYGPNHPRQMVLGGRIPEHQSCSLMRPTAQFRELYSPVIVAARESGELCDRLAGNDWIHRYCACCPGMGSLGLVLGQGAAATCFEPSCGYWEK